MCACRTAWQRLSVAPYCSHDGCGKARNLPDLRQACREKIPAILLATL
jgi:hypothetical protein